MNTDAAAYFARTMAGVWLADPAHLFAALCRRVRPMASNDAGLPMNAIAPWDAENAYAKPRTVNGVAVIPVNGPMDHRLDNFTKWFFGMTDTAEIRGWVESATADPSVKAIVLDTNTPGGNALGVPELADAVLAARDAGKPVVAHTDSLMASAGYYAAAGATAILSTRSAVVGSIGTYIAIYDWTRFLDSAGVELQLFASGDYKAAGIVGKPLTDKQRAHFQASVDAHAAEFRAFVQSGRPKVKSESMQGQTMRGGDALAAGLVDGISDLNGAINQAARLAEMGVA